MKLLKTTMLLLIPLVSTQLGATDFTFQITDSDPADEFKITAADLEVTISAASTPLTTTDPAGITVEYLATSTSTSKTFTIVETGYSNTLAKGNTDLVPLSLLPVELVLFTAKQDDNTVILNWKTASELNNLGFEVQHSTDGKTFEGLYFVAGHGTTTDPKHYAYTHKYPRPGFNYYRLMQVDTDGQTHEYSNIISIGVQNLDQTVRVYPNPTPRQVTIKNIDRHITIEIHNLLGQKVKAIYGDGVQQIDLSDLKSGQYIIKVYRKDHPIHTQQLVKL